MSSIERVFLADIRNEPDDNTPRLIFADWLTDNGQPERAEFVRVQLERDDLDEDDPAQDELERRQNHLIACHPEWLHDVPDWARARAMFERGFIQRIWGISGTEFFTNLDALFAIAPIENVSLELSETESRPGPRLPACLRVLNLTGSRPVGYLERLAECDHELGLEELGIFSGPILDSELNALFRSPLLRRLRRLLFYTTSLVHGGLPVLRGYPEFVSRLETLCLGSNGVDPEAMRLLVATPMRRLERLTLGHNRPGLPGLLDLLASSHFPALRELELHSVNLDPDEFQQLTASRGLANLTKLDLNWNRLGDEAVVALMRNRHLGPLRWLGLESDGLEESGVMALANSPAMQELRTLRLGSNRLTERAVVELVRSPNLAKLRRLELTLNYLDESALLALIDAWQLPNVTELNLSFQTITPQVAARLASARWASQLVKLDLGHSQLGARGAVELARSPYLTRLGQLRLSNADLGDAGTVALAQSPILAGVWNLELESNNIGLLGGQALVASPTQWHPTRLDLASNRGLPEAELTARFGRAVVL